MKRLLLPAVGVALVAATVGFGASATAAAPSPSRTAGHSHEILGVVPARGQAHSASRTGGAGSNLSYHGGPVMLSNTVYAVYWVPNGYSVSSNYENLINQFFTDVAAVNGTTGNVYATDTQYYNGSGTHIAYNSSFVKAIVDTDQFPKNGCSDSYTSVCISDAQLTTELAAVVTNGHLPTGSTTMYFMFTPKGVGSCYSSGSCAFSSYCAYHSNVSIVGVPTAYANMPYADTVPAACDAGQHPNGDDADATINVTSHEHNEGITDVFGTAWYDKRGYEDGDKCAWNFGAVSGTNGAEYNQSINGHNYFLQQEWSNASSSCVLHM